MLLSCCCLFFELAAEESDDAFEFFGDRTEVNLSKGKEYTKLYGNAKVISSNNELTADNIEVYGKQFRYLYCEGDVTFLDKKKGLYLTSITLFYDRKESRAKAKGNVIMEDRKNKLSAHAVSVEMSDGGARIVMQARVRIVRNNTVIRSELAVYDRTAQQLYLSGFPRVVQGDDIYEALEITLNLKTKEVRLKGAVQGSIRAKKKKDKKQEVQNP